MGAQQQTEQESVTPLAASASISGTSRQTTSTGKLGPMLWPLFRAFAASDQAGTVNIQQSLDGKIWWTTLTAPIVAAQGTVLESLCTLPFVRAQVVNGTTSQTTLLFVTSFVENN